MCGLLQSREESKKQALAAKREKRKEKRKKKKEEQKRKLEEEEAKVKETFDVQEQEKDSAEGPYIYASIKGAGLDSTLACSDHHET